jgi:hypothetical protein
MSPRWIVLGALLLGAIAPAVAIEPFIAPAVTQGEVEVRLHPTEGIGAGSTRLVTFGMPFPRGSITDAGLSTVRVLRDGVEIPAFVESLTPWRHRSNAAIDGQSVRVARIQISHNIAMVFPGSDSVTVQWGGTPRTLNVASLTNPRTAWHQVTTGSFIAADNVFEPDVYAVLPRSWLSRGLLKSSRSFPFDPSNTDVRDSPAANDAIMHWPEFQEAERAHKNNFYSVINQDPGSASAPSLYRTTAEPWLYDRSATMFVLYFRSGSFVALREAVRAAEFYADRQSAGGFFNFGGVGSDTKYAYNECIAYAYWTTGDNEFLAKIAPVTTAQNGFTHSWTPARGFWTERHAAFKLLANVVAYEVLGGNPRRDAVNQILADFRAHQDGAGGLVPSPRIDGALYHTGSQHDAGEMADFLGDYLASSWMTALVSDAVVRSYATGEDAPTAQFVARIGDFLAATVVQTTDHSYDTAAELALPRYSVLHNGSDALVQAADVEHSLDVAGQLAWARYFRELTGGNGASLSATALDVYETYDESVNYWIRPAAPPASTAYRVSPPRKWAWEHRTSDGIGFALSEEDPNAVFYSGFEAP